MNPTLFLASLAALAGAARGNPLSVDLAGNTFLHSAKTTANAFEFVGFRAIPTAMAAGVTTPVQIATGVSAVDLSVPTAATASGGVRLPALDSSNIGLRVTVRTPSAASYSLWGFAGAAINGASTASTAATVLAAEQIINCEGLENLQWLCTAPDGYTRAGLRTEALSTAPSTTVTVASATHVVDLTVGAASTTLTLPAPSLGKELTIHQKAPTAIAYTLAAASGTFINDAATTTSISVSAREPTIVCRGMSTSRWECTAPRGYINSRALVTTSVDITLTSADSGTLYTSVDSRTYTLPACTTEKLEFRFFQHKNTLTLTAPSSDYIIETEITSNGAHSASAAGGSVTVAAGSTAVVAGTVNGGSARVVCAQTGVWIATNYKYSGGG